MLYPLVVFLLGSCFLFVSSATAQPHFAPCADGAGNIFNATVVAPATSTPTVNGVTLAPGSEIAIFSETMPDFCIGTVTWDDDNTVITVWGDAPNTGGVRDGLREGERMRFRVWDAATHTEHGDDAVAVTFEAGPGFNAGNRYYHDAIYMLADLSVTASPSSSRPIGEARRVSVSQDNADQWHTVTFARSYNNPVVVLGPPSYNGAQPLTVRVRSLSGTGFAFQLDEWDYNNGIHTAETVSYFAVEAGTHQLSDGSSLTAGLLNGVDHTWKSVSFSTNFAAKPVVLAQTVSYNGAAAVTTRLQNVTSGGFSVRLQEEAGNDGQHADEAVGYIAIAPTQISFGPKLEAGRTGDSVTHDWHAISFGQSYGPNVVFLAAMQTYDGGDTATLRYDDLSADGVSVMVEEETSGDAETDHTPEVVGYLVMQSGTLKGSSATAAAKVSGEAEGLQQAAEEQPRPYGLEGNYPNPFNPVTTIQYRLPADGYVTLAVFNMLGQRVAVLVEGIQRAGLQQVRFDARTLPSGLYLYRIETDTFVEQKKMVLVK